MNTKRSFGYLFLAATVLLTGVQGCGDDDSGNDKPPVVNPTAGSSGKGSTGGKGGSGGTGGDDTTPEGGTGATAGKKAVEPTAGTDTGGQGGEGPVQPTCTLPELGEDGCFNCPKNGDVEQWLNRCVDSDCEPFDNATRLPLLKADGTLPALPN
jgi:hypothetical protein